MKAIILSAGRGKRLARASGEGPKCMVPVQGQPLIEWQLDSLARCGIPRASVVLGYGADKVRRLLSARRRPIRASVRTCSLLSYTRSIGRSLPSSVTSRPMTGWSRFAMAISGLAI